MNRISIVGIGKLGLCMAASLASRGYQVIGADVRRDLVDKINQGECPIQEPGLADLIKKHSAQIRATTSVTEAVQESEITFVVVATPLKADHRFSNAYLEKAIQEMGQALRGKKDRHVVAITSTVMPGTLESLIKPLLEKESGRRCGTDLFLAYNPEFIALGSVIRDFLEPDWVLIGEDSKEAGDLLEEVYKKVCLKTPPVVRMSTTNAEIAKLSLNCYITTKISYANSLAAICEHVPGANAREILQALGLDSRVGRKALLPGLGFGGPCFPRDNLAFQSFAREFGAVAPMAAAVQTINESQPARIAEIIHSQLPAPATIAVLGAAYKNHTNIIEESQAVMIACELARAGYRVRIYDALAQKHLESEWGGLLEVVTSTKDACAGAQACLLGLPSTAEVSVDSLMGWMLSPRIVIDPWNSMPTLAADPRFLYRPIGGGQASPTSIDPGDS